MAKHAMAGLAARAGRASASVREREAEEHKHIMETTTEAESLGELRFSPIEYRDPRELSPSPYNAVFERLKDDAYWRSLRRDIEEAGAITDPLLTLPDGEIVSGHSRQKVALELLSEGRLEFQKVPVRVLLSELSDLEKRKRVYLGNLSRFEVDANTRLRLYADIYPEYFGEERKAGEKTDTVSVSAIAEDLGVTERQVRRERAIFQAATKQAVEQGRNAPVVEDLADARAEENKKRKAKQTDTVSVSPRMEQNGGMSPIAVSSEAPDTDAGVKSEDEKSTSQSSPSLDESSSGPDVFSDRPPELRSFIRQEELDETIREVAKAIPKNVDPRITQAFLSGIHAVAVALSHTVSLGSLLEHLKALTTSPAEGK